MRVLASILFFAGSAAVLVVSARAQGVSGSGFSARSAALGGVFVESDLTGALAVNPAGLALISARVVDMNLLAAFGRGSYQNRVDSNGSLRSNLGVLPYGAVSTPIGRSRFTVAVGLIPDSLLSAKWRYVDAPGTGGASWGLQDHKSEIVAARTAFGFGFHVNSRLSIGGTAGLVYNRNTLQTPYIFQRHPVLAGLKTALDLQASGYGWNGTIGILARPTRRLQVGVAYKTSTAIATTGTATGTLDRQLAAIGLAARPDYRYDARVDNTLPQSVAATVAWQTSNRLRLISQMDWINWNRAFRTLPVLLTNGNNADVNGLVGSNSIRDGVPLDWRDQFVWRFGAETPVTDTFMFRTGGYFTQNPVPKATLTPLTGAIMKSAFTLGGGYTRGRWSFDAAYAMNLPATASVTTSSLQAGEYSGTRLRIWLQTLMLTTSFRF